jgi:hypothetical protein
MGFIQYVFQNTLLQVGMQFEKDHRWVTFMMTGNVHLDANSRYYLIASFCQNKFQNFSK